jgi:hypothetical protein
VHGQNRAPRKAFRLPGWRSFEGLWALAKPRLHNAIAAHALVHSARDSFHLGQLRHRLIVEGSATRSAHHNEVVILGGVCSFVTMALLWLSRYTEEKSGL